MMNNNAEVYVQENILVDVVCTPLFKSNRIFFQCQKSGIWFQNIDLQFYRLYYEVFWYEQVKFYNISFPRLLSVVV